MMHSCFIRLNKEYKNLILIAVGAFPGALIRWQVNHDFFVNLLGAALLGFLMGLSCGRHLKLILGFGFCGALTTFSGWIYDSAKLLKSGSFFNAFGLIFYMLGFGLLAAVCGLWLGKNFKLRGHLQ